MHVIPAHLNTNFGALLTMAQILPSRTACRQLLSLLCLSLLISCFPINAHSAPFLLDDTQQSASITQYSEYLHDATGQLTLNDVLSGDQNDQFQSAKGMMVTEGFTKNPWWIRVSLHNTSDQTLTRILGLWPGIFSRATAYIPEHGTFLPRHSGRSLTPPWADFRHRHQLYEVTLPSHETTTIYLRLVPEHTLAYGFYLRSLSAQMEYNQLIDGIYYFLFGITFGLLIYNCVLWFSSGNTSHIHYAAFLFFISLAIFAAAGFFAMRYPLLADTSIRLEALGFFMASFFSTAFTRRFFSTESHLFFVDRLLVHVMGAALIGGLLSWVLPVTIGLQISLLFTTASALLCFYTGCLAWRSRLPQAAIFCTARLPVLVCIMLVMSIALGIGGLPVEPPFIIVTAVAIEAILITIGIHLKERKAVDSDMNEARQKAVIETTWRTRSETLARLNHEIRTPMSGVLGMAEILYDTALTPNQREYVRAIQESGYGLLQTLNDVLEYARIETDEVPLNHGVFNVTELLMETLELFRDRAEEKNIELIAHIHNNVPIGVSGDATRLRQIMTHILGSCLRQALAGEIVFNLSRDPAGRADHLSFEIEGSALRHAHPLPPEHDQPVEKEHDQIGLHIAWQMVETMGGRHMEREARRGLLLGFSLPLPEVEGVAGSAQPPDLHLLEGRRLLVVDDSPTVTRVIRQQAIPWGLKVTPCHDPMEALASIRSQITIDEAYDIVLLDQQMPGMTGLQLAARVIEDPLIQPAPIMVMLTGIHRAPSASVTRDLGIHSALTKPVSSHRLQAALVEAIRNNRREAQQHSGAPQQLRVLVIDNSPSDHDAIKSVFGSFSIQPDLVATNTDAIRQALRQHYDLIFITLDVSDTDLTGIASRVRLLERRQGRDPVPIIAMTEHPVEESQLSATSEINACIEKPVDAKTLREVLLQFTALSSAETYQDSPHANDERHG